MARFAASVMPNERPMRDWIRPVHHRPGL